MVTHFAAIFTEQLGVYPRKRQKMEVLPSLLGKPLSAGFIHFHLCSEVLGQRLYLTIVIAGGEPMITMQALGGELRSQKPWEWFGKKSGFQNLNNVLKRV